MNFFIIIRTLPEKKEDRILRRRSLTNYWSSFMVQSFFISQAEDVVWMNIWLTSSPSRWRAICLKCWNTSNLFDSFAIRAKQEITILVLRSASFREALSICRLALSRRKPLWHHAKLTWVIIELQQEGIFSQNLKWKRCITVKFFLFFRETFLPGMENLHCN